MRGRDKEGCEQSLCGDTDAGVGQEVVGVAATIREQIEEGIDRERAALDRPAECRLAAFDLGPRGVEPSVAEPVDPRCHG